MSAATSFLTSLGKKMFHYHANDVSLPFQDPFSYGITYSTQNCAPKIYAAEGTQFFFLLSHSVFL